MATLEIEARGSAILTIFYPIDVMFGKVNPEPSTELNNTTNHPEYVWGTLVETYLKMSKQVCEEFTHWNPNHTFYKRK